MKKILFVCTGNTCRSPMAESIMKHLIDKKRVKDIKVLSCGLSADVGQPMNENAVTALKSLDIKPHKHKARQFEKKFLEEYNLILTMTNSQKELLQGHKNVFTIGELTSTEDINDPYGLPPENYKITANLLIKACAIILDTIT